MTVVVRDGKLMDVGDVRKSWPLAGTQSQMRVRSRKLTDLVGFDASATFAGIYSSQPWIFALVNKLSRNIARLPLATFAEDPDDGTATRLRHTQHELPRLLRRPYPRGSRFKLLEHTIGSVAVFGNALWWKYRPRPGMAPVELWPIDWRYVEMQTGKQAPIDFYEYQGPAGRRIFFPEDVVHFQWWSPQGIVGTSPLEPLALTLSLEDAGRRYSVASFANGIRPSGALVAERHLDDEDRDELKAELEAIHSNPDNAFRMMLLDGGLDWKSFSQTAVDAQLLDLRKLNHVEACAVYDVPPPVVHILDRATYSNISEQHAMLYVDTIGPWLGMLEETVMAELVIGEPTLEAAFVADAAAEGEAPAEEEEEAELLDTKIAFDLSELLRPDIDKRGQAYVNMRNAGAYTINDVRAAENKPKIDHPAADAVLVPLNMDVIGQQGVDLGLAPRGGTAQAALDALAEHLKGATEETAREVRELAAAVERKGDGELAAAIMAMVGEREPVRIELEPRHQKLEQVTHEHHSHEHTVPPDFVRGEIEAALEAREEPSVKRFEYEDGLVARIVKVHADGTEEIAAVERDADGNLVSIADIRSAS